MMPRQFRIQFPISLLLALSLGLLALLPRLYQLGAQSLWLDEGSSWELSRAPWGELLRDLLDPRAAYPLYHLILKAWMALFGSSELALRLPSALVGAVVVPLLYLTALELTQLGAAPAAHGRWYGLTVALLALCAPFAIWYSQEVKVYSLLLLGATLILLALVRALRHNRRSAWITLLLLSLLLLFIHRLGALLLVAAIWGWALHQPLASPRAHPRWWPVGLALLAALALGVAMVGGLGGEQAAGRAAAGAAIPATPGLALLLTVVRFSIDRWPGDGPWWWLLPWLVLALWGLVALLADLRRPTTRPRAQLLLLLLMLPLLIFLAQLTITRLYEARYLMVIFPLWLLLLAYPALRLVARRLWERVAYLLLLVAALGTSWLALTQPTFGLFSGDPVKEQYREAMAALATRLHPDDAVIIHPGYLAPLYHYYMGRLSADPAPQPISFANFWQGETDFGRREWEQELRGQLSGRTRSWLLIAPEHARTVDRPAPGDEYGMVGLFWAYSREQQAWPCGIWRYNGIHLLCQESPEAYVTGEVQQPRIPVGVRFGDAMTLLGYTLKATTPDGPGVYRAGGNLPISLFWEVTVPPTTDYSLFLHLCQRCDQPPVAGEDGPPLEGYLPTSVWLPGNPARDDRAIALPADLAPGRYTLLLGLYDPSNPGEAGRLEVHGEGNMGAGRLLLGTVEVVAPDAAPGVPVQP